MAGARRVAPRRVVGTKYYVSPNGSDSNSGKSPSSPFLTVTKVNTLVLKAGDSVLFQGGQTFTGTISIGTANWSTASPPSSKNPVTFGSYGAGRAQINSDSNTDGITLANIGCWVVTNLKIVGIGQTFAAGPAGIRFVSSLTDGKHLMAIAVIGCDISGFGSSGIVGETTTETTFYDGINLKYNTVHENMDSGIECYDDVATPLARQFLNLLIVGNEVYGNTGTAASWNTGNGISIAYASTGLIELNYVHDNGISDTQGCVGVWGYESTDLIFRRNITCDQKTACGTDGGGYDADGSCINCLFEYNYASGCYGAGYQVGTYSGSGATSAIFRYNIGENNGVAHTAEVNLFVIGGACSAVFYNNIFYNSNGRAIVYGDSSEGAGSAVATFYNNILFSTGGALIDANTINPPWTFAGNDYWTTGTFAIKWNGTTYSTLAAWQAATGQEKIAGIGVGFSVDPKLTSPGGGGILTGFYNPGALTAYQLQHASPMIGVGLDLKAQFSIDPGNVDYFGDYLPNGVGTGFSIGADCHPDAIAPPDWAFNPTPVIGTGTLSNSNLTLLATGYPYTSFIGTVALSGKQVFAANADVTGNYAIIGVGNATSGGSYIGATANSVGYFNTGFAALNGITAGSPPTFGEQTVGVVVDKVGGNLWVTLDGVNFYGISSSPITSAAVAAGTGGINISSITGPLYPILGSLNNNTLQWTIETYPWTIPSGYAEY